MTAELSALLERGMAAGHETILVAPDGAAISRGRFRAMVAAARRELRRGGDPRGRRLALHGTVTPELVACLVACLIDGAVAIPIDAELPDRRKRAMLELAGDPTVLDFGGSPAPDAAESAAPPARPDQDDPCYVFFTSGTTGAPKGVVGRRAGLAHFLDWERGALGLEPGDRVSILTRLSFDVVLRDILLPIAGGATGCIAPRDLRPGDVLDWMDERSVTVTHVVPSLARSFLAASRPGFAGRTLRHSLFAGEPLSGSLVRSWRAAFPATAIYNLYGPTETTLAKFCARIGDHAPDGILPCGHPLPGASAIIVDGSRAPLPSGQTGEVAIATPHRSLGYLDPGQTAERFVRIDGREVYLTGDLGFLAPDGQLHLRGRVDDQVKILGVRIELSGVAALIQGFDGVGDAAAVCVGDGEDRRLVAYFTARGGRATAQALRGYLADRLPPAAIPSRFIQLEAMPLTANGKLDRSRLPPPEPTGPAEPPADDVEQVLADAFAAALNRTGIGALDDFFALGGDSLAAAGVCAALERRLGAHLRPADFLSAPTPRALAERVRPAWTPIPRAPVRRFFPLTPQQRRYFRTFCAGGNRSWCNMVALFPLPPETTRAAVEEALADILVRHDSLRLAFTFDESGVIRQSIEFGWDPSVGEGDLADLEPGAAPAAIDRLRIAEAERPIPPMGRGPLFRAQLLHLAGGERRLLWNVHHLISDGTSQGILARELADFLAGRRAGEDERFRAPSFADVAAWAAERPNLGEARDHFLSLFAGGYRHRYLTALVPASDPQRCLSLECALPPAVREGMRSAARAHRCTPYAVLLAACFRLMSRRADAADLAIVTPLAGRDHPQVAPLIGDFINLVPLRIPDVPALSPRSLIDQVKGQVRDAAGHQQFQFDELLDELGLPFDPDRNPLTGLSLNFMPQTGPMPPLAGRVVDRGYKLKYDVLFLVRDYADATAVEIQFRAGLLDGGAAAALFGDLCTAIEGLSHE